jgi:L,D-transpeptidase YbiS
MTVMIVALIAAAGILRSCVSAPLQLKQAPVTPAAVETVVEANDVAGILRQHEWDTYVKQGVGLWVRVGTQELNVVQDGQIVRTYRCSTATRGTGNLRDSEKTPLGWHEIGAKIGDKLPVGAVLEERRWKGKVWQPGEKTDADLVLTRVLRLRGLQSGYNLGGNVDSWERCIYIHGTNDVEELGRPTSHGCVRLSPTEVIELFDSVRVGCRVLITQQ